MPIITFWSNSEKAIGQTVAASLASTVRAMEHNYKVLLVSVDFNDNVVEECFGAQESNKDIIRSLVQKAQINLELRKTILSTLPELNNAVTNVNELTQSEIKRIAVEKIKQNIFSSPQKNLFAAEMIKDFFTLAVA